MSDSNTDAPGKPGQVRRYDADGNGYWADPPTNWKSIDTAPVGVPVLVYIPRGHGNTCFAVAADERNSVSDVSDWRVQPGMDYDDADWMRMIEPTLWMPLPAAPDPLP